MTLGDIIAILEAIDDKPVPFGFGAPMSYRGYYDEIAFPPERDTTVGKMLEHARSAVGMTFPGYKGGYFKMNDYTDCWLAEHGELGEALGPTLLMYMLGEKP